MVSLDVNPQVYDDAFTIANGYYGSAYNHWDVKEFKHINLRKFYWNAKPMFGKKRYSNNDLLVIKLIDYYRDLNKLLERVLTGHVDKMFFRFAAKLHLFSFDQIFKAVTQTWDEAFNDACLVYLKESHHTYDESYGISYVAFFESHFWFYLYRAFTIVELSFNQTQSNLFKGTYLENNLSRCVEMYRLSWVDSTYRSSYPLYLEDQYLGFLIPEKSQQLLSIR